MAKAEISSILWFAAGSATFNAKTDHDKTEGILYAVLAHPQNLSSFWKLQFMSGT